MARFVMPGLSALMQSRVTLKDVEKIVDKLGIIPSDEIFTASPDSVNIASLQLFCKRYQNLADYIVDMNLYVADAVNRRAQFIVFPAFTGFLCASYLPQFENYLSKLVPLADTGLPDIESLGSVLAYYSDVMFDAYFHTMSALASRHKVYIMAGSALYFDENEPRHRAFLFDDGGSLIGFQDKLSLGKLERAMQIEPASEIKTFDTPVGPLAMLIGSDVDYFETVRVAKNLGAKIILNPTIFIGDYTPVDAALGLSLRVQENNIFGVQSTLVGDTGLGFVMEGPACVFAPRELLRSRSKNGLMAQSSGRIAPDVLIARLGIDSLESNRNPYSHDKNPSFLERYSDRLY